jgi:hypothetical protein
MCLLKFKTLSSILAQHRRQQAEQERVRREQILNGIPLQGEARATQNVAELSEEELLISSPIVYAFSLADKLWREYPFKT